jgi:hypothetical protein
MNSEYVAYARMNALLREVASKHPTRVAVVSLESRVCPSGRQCAYVVDRFNPKPSSAEQILRPDGTHYYLAGSLWVAKWLVPQITATAQRLS